MAHINSIKKLKFVQNSGAESGQKARLGNVKTKLGNLHRYPKGDKIICVTNKGQHL